MIENLSDTMFQAGVLGAVCLFFMWKDVRKDAHIVKTLDKIAVIIDERIAK